MGFDFKDPLGIASQDDAKIDQASTLNKGQKNLLNSLTAFLQQQLGNGVSAYGGQTVSGASPLQTDAFGLANTVASQAGGNYAQGQNFLNSAQSNLNAATQNFDPQTVMDALKPGQTMALNTFNRELAPQLVEKYGANSGGSGAMNKALAGASKDLSLGLNAQAAPYLIQGQQDQLNRQLQGATIANNLALTPGELSNQGANLAGNIFNIGAGERSITNEQLQAEYQKWLQSQGYNNPWLNLMPSALGTQAFENVVTPPAPTILSQLSSAAGAVGKFVSDRAVKENITPMDNALEKVKSLTGYSYNYTFNETANRNGGIIAQDLEKILPDAVSEIGGIKYVRYDAVIALLINAVKELAEKVENTK